MNVSFKDIKGQDRAIRSLKTALGSEKAAHAYLFFGPSGVGKKLAALEFARALNCEARTEDGSCGLCVPCKKIAASNHPDVFIMKPEKDASSISIDQVRGLIRVLALKAYEGKRKVCIVEDAHLMKHEAQNALLKTLEEPPADSCLILLTHDIALLFPTIQSRCQGVKFFPLAADEVKSILIKEHKTDGARAHVVSRLSSGSLGEAIRLKDDAFFTKRSRIVKSLAAGTFFDSDFDGASKSDIRAYLNILLTWYRDVLIAKAGDDAGMSSIINIDEKESILAEARRMEFDELEAMIERIISTGVFLDQNANPKLAMAALSAQAFAG